MYRNTWMEIDLDAVKYNVKKAIELSGRKVIAVVKADAYGCGDQMIAKAAIEAGAFMLAVSSLDEAVILRKEGFTEDILVLGHVDAENIPVMIENGISATIYSKQFAAQLTAYDLHGLKAHLKVDTGMNRIGFKSQAELNEAAERLEHAGANLTGIFTHFCCTDSDPAMTAKQFERFSAMVKGTGRDFALIHCDNSDATLTFKDDLSNACRYGVSMYGVSPYVKDLKHPVSFYTRVFMIKEVAAGETVGYGATYTAKENEWIGTMPVGYADGLIRANQGRRVYVNGEEAEIVGRVCMDQTMIRLSKPCEEGSLVEIFGPHIAIEDMANDLHTIPYEILCLISDRVTRVYKEQGTTVREHNIRLESVENQ